MSHYLGYSITPVPYPILASPEHGNPNQIDLQVMVSGPPPDSGKSGLKWAAITFPVSDHSPGGQYLSDAPELPAPVYDEKGPWTVTVVGGTVTIKPKSQSAEFDSLLFELKGIPVDPTKGVVQVGVEEKWGGESPVSDTDAVELVKLADDYPVTKFWTAPAALHEINPVTLHWETADSSTRQISFEIEPSRLAPGSYDAADGVKGVATATDLDADTVIKLIPKETGERLEPVDLRVPVEVPYISPQSNVETFGATNRVVAMRWWTENATTCAVSVDGKVIDAEAPLETYHQPYPLILGGDPGNHELKLEAYGQGEPGSSHKPSVSFKESETTSPVVTVENGGAIPLWSTPFACTPDGKSLIISGYEVRGEESVTMLTLRDARSGVLQKKVFCSSRDLWYCGVQLTAEGTTGIAFGTQIFGTQFVYRFDLSTEKVTLLQEDESEFGFAITPDGQTLLILSEGSLSAAPVALPSKVTTLAHGAFGNSRGGGSNVAFSHDGKRAFVAGSPNLVVVDLSTMSVEHEVELAVTKANKVFSATISPDGAFLLLIAEDGNTAAWRTIDLSSLKEVGGKTSTAILAGISSPIFFPQGMLALASARSAGLVVLDLYREKETWFRYPISGQVFGMAFVPDGGPLAIRSIPEPAMMDTLYLL